MKKFLVYLFLCAFYNGSIFSQTLIVDLYPGVNSSEPMFENAEQIGNELYFTASEAGSGICLYKTNGTDITRIEGDPNTFQVYSILGSLGGELYYFELYLDYCKLYKTSGGVGETQLLYDFNVNSLVIPLKISTVVDDVMYFYGCEGNTGYELWRTDGTTLGTYLLKDIYPGTSSSLLFSTAENHPYFAHSNGIIFFGAADGVNGSELWRSDGTEGGTYMLKNLESVSHEFEFFGSNPSYFIKFNDAIYFSAYRSEDGSDLFVEVFPNPCVDRMQVNLSVDCAELEFVQILDVSGVESKVNYQIENFNSISLTGLDRFSSGIYFLTLATKQGHKILQKFVIQ